MRLFQLDNTYMEWFRTIYKGTYGHRIIAEPLIRFDKDFNLIPAAANSWEPADDGLGWYFYLRDDLEFSDGKPLTAHDYVFTLRRGADPDNAYDVEWLLPADQELEPGRGRKAAPGFAGRPRDRRPHPARRDRRTLRLHARPAGRQLGLAPTGGREARRRLVDQS